MAVNVTDSATPAHDSIGVSGRKCRVPGSSGCQRRRLKTVSRGAGVLAVSVILGGVWET